MPSVAVVATQLTDRTSRAYTLTVGGVEVLGAFAGAPFLVPIESITVQEEGVGGVSSMDFDIWDPSLLVNLSQMAEVIFHDVTNDVRIFRGLVDSWSLSGVIGRTISVSCVGIEKALDWAVVGSLTIPAATALPDGIASCYANSTGGIALNATWTNSQNGTAANPIGDLTTVASPHSYAYTDSAVTVTAQTLREAILDLIAVARVDNLAGDSVIVTVAISVTIDFYGGLRVWPAGNTPGGYASLTVDESTTTATFLEHETDAGGVIRGVYVTGGNAAGTGLVSDGTGLPGPVASISDSSITTAAMRDAAGNAYLLDKATATRGRLRLEKFSPTTSIHVGSPLTLTNTAAGLSGASYTISGLTKTFQPGGTQTWDVSYGALPPSGARVIRRYTKSSIA